ncbi:hypothetical protein [Dyadobacter tibetensis]|uniref:hypothetical protein n=1 Tax=Dyadobacter tibetensis TaxID=1211851 RepID=UPI000471E61B|nr:hypothetical protein [Dyadobacter tibetensis]
MFILFLTLHSFVRWILLLFLIYTTIKAYAGWKSGKEFSEADRWLGHWTNTFAQVQLTLGILVFVKSALAKYFWANLNEVALDSEATFFGLFHMVGMALAVTVISIAVGSSKRQKEDQAKFKKLFQWFLLAIIIILIFIPWPFSPLASRPWIRL